MVDFGARLFGQSSVSLSARLVLTIIALRGRIRYIPVMQNRTRCAPNRRRTVGIGSLTGFRRFGDSLTTFSVVRELKDRLLKGLVGSADSSDSLCRFCWSRAHSRLSGWSLPILVILCVDSVVRELMSGSLAGVCRFWRLSV